MHPLNHHSPLLQSNEQIKVLSLEELIGDLSFNLPLKMRSYFEFLTGKNQPDPRNAIDTWLKNKFLSTTFGSSSQAKKERQHSLLDADELVSKTGVKNAAALLSRGYQIVLKRKKRSTDEQEQEQLQEALKLFIQQLRKLLKHHPQECNEARSNHYKFDSEVISPSFHQELQSTFNSRDRIGIFKLFAIGTVILSGLGGVFGYLFGRGKVDIPAPKNITLRSFNCTTTPALPFPSLPFYEPFSIDSNLSSKDIIEISQDELLEWQKKAYEYDQLQTQFDHRQRTINLFQGNLSVQHQVHYRSHLYKSMIHPRLEAWDDNALDAYAIKAFLESATLPYDAIDFDDIYEQAQRLLGDLLYNDSPTMEEVRKYILDNIDKFDHRLIELFGNICLKKANSVPFATKLYKNLFDKGLGFESAEKELLKYILDTDPDHYKAIGEFLFDAGFWHLKYQNKLVGVARTFLDEMPIDLLRDNICLSIFVEIVERRNDFRLGLNLLQKYIKNENNFWWILIEFLKNSPHPQRYEKVSKIISDYIGPVDSNGQPTRLLSQKGCQSLIDLVYHGFFYESTAIKAFVIDVAKKLTPHLIHHLPEMDYKVKNVAALLASANEYSTPFAIARAYTLLGHHENAVSIWQSLIQHLPTGTIPSFAVALEINAGDCVVHYSILKHLQYWIKTTPVVDGLKYNQEDIQKAKVAIAKIFLRNSIGTYNKGSGIELSLELIKTLLENGESLFSLKDIIFNIADEHAGLVVNLIRQHLETQTAESGIDEVIDLAIQKWAASEKVSSVLLELVMPPHNTNIELMEHLAVQWLKLPATADDVSTIKDLFDYMFFQPQFNPKHLEPAVNEIHPTQISTLIYVLNSMIEKGYCDTDSRIKLVKQAISTWCGYKKFHTNIHALTKTAMKNGLDTIGRHYISNLQRIDNENGMISQDTAVEDACDIFKDLFERNKGFKGFKTYLVALSEKSLGYYSQGFILEALNAWIKQFGSNPIYIEDIREISKLALSKWSSKDLNHIAKSLIDIKEFEPLIYRLPFDLQAGNPIAFLYYRLMKEELLKIDELKQSAIFKRVLDESRKGLLALKLDEKGINRNLLDRLKDPFKSSHNLLIDVFDHDLANHTAAKSPIGSLIIKHAEALGYEYIQDPKRYEYSIKYSLSLFTEMTKRGRWDVYPGKNSQPFLSHPLIIASNAFSQLKDDMGAVATERLTLITNLLLAAFDGHYIGVRASPELFIDAMVSHLERYEHITKLKWTDGEDLTHIHEMANNMLQQAYNFAYRFLVKGKTQVPALEFINRVGLAPNKFAADLTYKLAILLDDTNADRVMTLLGQWQTSTFLEHQQKVFELIQTFIEKANTHDEIVGLQSSLKKWRTGKVFNAHSDDKNVSIAKNEARLLATQSYTQLMEKNLSLDKSWSTTYHDALEAIKEALQHKDNRIFEEGLRLVQFIINKMKGVSKPQDLVDFDREVIETVSNGIQKTAMEYFDDKPHKKRIEQSLKIFAELHSKQLFPSSQSSEKAKPYIQQCVAYGQTYGFAIPDALK